MIRKSLNVNTVSGPTLGPIEIALLDLNIDDQNFMYNFVVCTKLKQHLILWLNFAERYRIGMENSFLDMNARKKAPSMKTNDFGQWTIASLTISANEQTETEQKLCLITTNIVTIPPYHISIFPLQAINQEINTNIQPDALIEIEENTFLTIEQLDLILIPTLQKLGPSVSNVYMAVLWNPGDQTVTLKRKHDHDLCKWIWLHGKRPPRATWNSRKNDGNTTYRTPSDTVWELTEISHDILPPMPEKIAFMFHNNFYPKPKIDLKDTEISQETRQKL